ncbi:MAG: phosphate ABC transporter permease subunit PstC [Candidatus Altiarchaeota archaeon]|nr:phosphate ABC transporter permease subunit PstC [Candidatus Altiarchaeota archaeon]
MMEGKQFNAENIVKGTLLLFAMTAALILLLIFLFLLREGMPLFSEVSPLEFIFGTTWNPSKGSFGAFNFIAGSIMVTLLSLIIAVPLSISCAIFLSEVAPRRVRDIVRPAIELLAGVPSIIYAAIAVAVLIVFIQYDIGNIVNGEAFRTGEGIFAVSITLAIMVLPIITSISQDSLESVPESFKKGSFALGSTQWQTIKGVVIPTALPGILAGSILGMGRLVGETIVVILVYGNAKQITSALFGAKSTGTTLTSAILLEMSYVPVGSTWYSALFSLGLILLVTVFILSLISNYMLSKSRVKQ